MNEAQKKGADGTCETMKVKWIKGDGEVTINVEDFDPKLHKKIEDKKDDKK